MYKHHLRAIQAEFTRKLGEFREMHDLRLHSKESMRKALF